jgi:holin-like protein
MLEAIARVLFWLGVGEIAARLGLLPIPGPVVGLVLLYADLTLRGDLPKDLGTLADRVLQLLGMLFVPAGVGVVAYLDLLRSELLPILAAVIGGTTVTILVTAFVAERVSRRAEKRREQMSDAPEKVVEGGTRDVRV